MIVRAFIRHTYAIAQGLVIYRKATKTVPATTKLGALGPNLRYSQGADFLIALDFDPGRIDRVSHGLHQLFGRLEQKVIAQGEVGLLQTRGAPKGGRGVQGKDKGSRGTLALFLDLALPAKAID
eukprot:scaffold2069_cov187-Amphora_coffeaeformis.AAC.23